MSANRKLAMARSAYRAWCRDAGRAFDAAIAAAETWEECGTTFHTVDLSGHVAPVNDAWRPLMKWADVTLRCVN